MILRLPFFVFSTRSWRPARRAMPGSSGKLLRASLVVLIGYAALVVLTYWVFEKAPTGFMPQQDQGRLIVSMQLPDSASLTRTKEVLAEVEKIARDTPGVAHTTTVAGLSFLQQANSFELRLDVRRARSVRGATDARAARPGNHGQAAAQMAQAGQGRDGARCSAPRPFRG